MRTPLLALAIAASVQFASGQAILFDFDNAPVHSPLPIDVSAGGIVAHLSAGFYNYSIQQANVLGFTPEGFSGLCVYPNSVYLENLKVSFSQTIDDFSILYAPEEYGCDSSARMRVTAYLGASFVGTATTTAPNPGTWPTGTLRYTSANPFDRVVIHYDAPPPTGGDWGPIFLADNMRVTAAVPEPATVVALGAALAAFLAKRRR